MKKYAVICGSRSGSTYLCDLLTATNRCGNPQEFFNKSMGYPADRHILLKGYTTPNDVFGVKIVGLDQWNEFVKSGLQISHWIWLEREDSVLQAISRYIAFSTNGWHKKTKPPEYSYEGIKWCLDEIGVENLYYHMLLAPNPHLKLSYETDICENPEQSVTAILQYLDITTNELPRIPIVRQSTDDINHQWKLRFNEENRS